MKWSVIMICLLVFFTCGCTNNKKTNSINTNDPTFSSLEINEKIKKVVIELSNLIENSITTEVQLNKEETGDIYDFVTNNNTVEESNSIYNLKEIAVLDKFLEYSSTCENVLGITDIDLKRCELLKNELDDLLK